MLGGIIAASANLTWLLIAARDFARLSPDAVNQAKILPILENNGGVRVFALSVSLLLAVVTLRFVMLRGMLIKLIWFFIVESQAIIYAFLTG